MSYEDKNARYLEGCKDKFPCDECPDVDECEESYQIGKERYANAYNCAHGIEPIIHPAFDGEKEIW